MKTEQHVKNKTQFVLKTFTPHFAISFSLMITWLLLSSSPPPEVFWANYLHKPRKHGCMKENKMDSICWAQMVFACRCFFLSAVGERISCGSRAAGSAILHPRSSASSLRRQPKISCPFPNSRTSLPSGGLNFVPLKAHNFDT